MSYDDDVIIHYGTLRKSGRYPYGSGGDLIKTVDKLSAQGLTEIEISKALGISTTDLRNQKTLEKGAEKERQRLQAIRLKDTGMSIATIARELSIPDSSVRDILKPAANAKYRAIKLVADVLADAVERFKYVDVGEGVNIFLGVTDTMMKNAIAMLETSGYKLQFIKQTQLGTGKPTSIKVLTKNDVEYKELYTNKSDISIPNHISNDMGLSFTDIAVVPNISLDRVKVVYANEGGSDRDGLIELRGNVDDLSLGTKRYGQVRIAVNGTHYLKGMAVHPPTMPDGVDVVFYTSKVDKGDPLLAMKPQNTVGDNVFGAIYRPNTITKADGTTTPSLVNVVNEEGDWTDWNKTLASQLLSKQSPRLAAGQLKIAYDNMISDYDDIMTVTNPIVKQHLLMEFAEGVDSAAVHLKAAALPRQTTNVLIPSTSVKPNEVYAPNYRNGEQVVLVRYPHGGTFEIPTLRVNNRNPEMRATIGSALDAIGIHPDVATRLSGADFDGDTVLVIPNETNAIRTAPALAGLKGFDPKKAYPGFEGMKRMTPEQTQRKMGDVSNLITDMTIKGASMAEIARAVRHSQVVIDAEKHGLNYKQSAIDNGISALKERYQGGKTRGASTVISKAGSQERIPHRRDRYSIDPLTGAKVWVATGETYIDKNGKAFEKSTKSTKMYEETDAHNLSSGTAIEGVYADHANRLKSLANKARLGVVNTKPIQYSPSARLKYKEQVQSLDAKLQLSMRHQPLERKAQLVGAELYRLKKKNNPGMSKADQRKEKFRSLTTARTRLKSTKPVLSITPKEWEAIQLGAVTPTRLRAILRYADQDQVRSLATPKTAVDGLSTPKVARAQVLLKAGYTAAEVAQVVGATQSQIININR